MELRLPYNHYERLCEELTRAGKQEIGGILMGEQLTPGQFRIVEVTYQRRGGTLATFVRSAHSALQALKNFFLRTKNNYPRFNYLGEWHSHPTFDTIPSVKDHHSMIEIIENPKTNANFLVLLIIKLKNNNFEATVTTYLPDGTAYKGNLILE